jgi:DNA-binding MarR family transcriptional regulator
MRLSNRDEASHPEAVAHDTPPSAEANATADNAAAAQVLRRLRVIFNAVRTHFQQVEQHAGIGGAQVWALSLVAREPGIGVGRLARAMDIHQTTASNLVKALLARGLVSSVRSPSDRRSVQLHPLPAGLDILGRAPGPFSGVLPAALAQMDPAVLARLDQDLGMLVKLLQADERAAGLPLAQM